MTMFLAQVIAVDDAAPPQTGTATISVTVTNVNDNSPSITTPGTDCHVLLLLLLCIKDTT